MEFCDALQNFTAVGCDTNGNDGMTTSALRTWSSIDVLCIASFAVQIGPNILIGFYDQNFQLQKIDFSATLIALCGRSYDKEHNSRGSAAADP